MADVGQNQWDFLIPGQLYSHFSELSVTLQYYFVLFCLWSIVWVVCLGLFVARLDYTAIKVRSPYLCISSAIGGQICLICNSLDIILLHSNYPCFIEIWSTMAFLPLYFIPFVLRFIRYYVTMNEFSKWKQGLVKDPRDSIWLSDGIWVGLLLLIFGIIMGITSIISSTILIDFITAYGCRLDNITYIFLLTLFAISIIIIVIILVSHSKTADPYHLNGELITTAVIWVTTLLPYILTRRYKPEIGQYLLALEFIFTVTGFFTSIIYPVFLSFKRPPIYNTPDKILDTIEEITLDKETYPLVEDVALRHDASEVPPFLRAIFEYRRITDPVEQKEAARAIFDRFMNPNSPECNNLSHLMVSNIEARLDEPTSDLFNGPYKEITKLLRQNFLLEIKQLPEYIRIVSERREAIEQMRRTRALLEGRN